MPGDHLGALEKLLLLLQVLQHFLFGGADFIFLRRLGRNASRDPLNSSNHGVGVLVIGGDAPMLFYVVCNSMEGVIVEQCGFVGCVRKS